MLIKSYEIKKKLQPISLFFLFSFSRGMENVCVLKPWIDLLFSFVQQRVWFEFGLWTTCYL